MTHPCLPWAIHTGLPNVAASVLACLFVLAMTPSPASAATSSSAAAAVAAAAGSPPSYVITAAMPTATGAASDSLWIVPATRTDARGLGMGEALLADDRSIGSLLANPAALGHLRHDRSLAVGTHHDGAVNRMGHTFLAPLLRDPVHRLAVSASWQHRGDRRFSLLGDAPYRPPDWQLGDASLVYSATLEKRVSLAVEQRVYRAQAELGGIWTTTSRLGVFYRPDPSISYGFILDGLGRTPMVRLGGDGRTRTGSSAPGESIEIGSVFRYPFEFRPTRVVLAFSSRKDFDVEGILYKAGVEFLATPWLVLRGGFLLRSYSDQDGPRAGMGLRGRHLWLDYGVAYSDRRGEYLHRLSLTIPFPRSASTW